MRYLLDTHTYLWWMSQPERLGVEARSALEERASLVFVSVATFWELSIKVSLGKLSLSLGVEQLAEALVNDGFSLLPIKISHCAVVSGLPFHHRDPFDRLLAAQSLNENLILLSRDEAFDSYSVSRLW